MEIRYKELGHTLVELGHQVDIYTLRLNASDPIQEVMDGLVIHRITNAFHYFSSVWGLRNYPDVLFFTLKLLKYRRELERFDAIIFNKWPVIPSIVLPIFIKNKFIIDWCEIYSGSIFWNFIYRCMTWQKSIAHIAVNQKICDSLNNLYGISPKKSRAIISGINPEKFSTNPEEKENKSILFLGRLNKHKNPELVIKAFLLNKLYDKGYRLNIVGNGHLFDVLKSAYDGKYNIAIHGYVNDHVKSNFLKKASLLVLTSKREGFPVVCAEASAAGTPTLTILNPDNGTVNVVTEFGIGWIANVNTNELANKIECYGDKNYWEWKFVSERCVKSSHNKFAWTVVAQELVTFINDYA
jgi:glycosyltransferase involved in cell wall biosynthesis